MKKIFAIILSLLMVLPMCMSVCAEGEVIPFDSAWEISTSSQMGTTVERAFDGNISTYWHSRYTTKDGEITGKDEAPFTITVNFGNEIEVSGWRYTPRNDRNTGTILSYNIYASKDGENFVKIYAGTFGYDSKKVDEFTPTDVSWGAYTMKAVKIEVTSGIGGYGTAAEFEFLKGTSGEAIKNGEAYKEGNGESDKITYIPFEESWKIDQTSAIGNHIAAKAFDGNTNTYWHSFYKPVDGTIVEKDTVPYTIKVEFPEVKDVSGWKYTPRTDNVNGTVKAYNIKGSVDGTTFEKFYSGTFNYTNKISENTPEIVTWETKKAKVIEIEITETVGGYGSAAEIQFIEKADIEVKAEEKTETEEVKKEEAVSEGTAKNGVPYLSRKGWNIKVNSTKADISRAIDGDLKTYWHSDYTADGGTIIKHDVPPYYIDIDFGGECVISGINMVPRQDNTNGNFNMVNVYVAEKSEDELTLIKENVAFEETTSDKEIFFLNNIKASKMRIEVIGTRGGYGTLSELYVLSENPEFTVVSYEEFIENDKMGRVTPIDARDFEIEFTGLNWNNATPDKMIDGSSTTIWQTEELKNGEEPYFVIDMKKVYNVKEFTYTPRQTADFHGCWLNVTISASADNDNWFTVAENVALEKNLDTKKIVFPEAVEARYIEVLIHEYYAKRVSCAEIGVYQRAKEEVDETYVLKIGSNEIKYSTENGEGTKTIDVAPYIVNGTTLIPLRGLLELMGAEISWNGDNQVIGITADGGIDITLQIDYQLVFVEDPQFGRVRYTLRTVPTIKDSRTFIPVRFVSEQLGYNVAWNGETGEITITK